MNSEAKRRALRGVLCSTVGGVFWGISGACGQYLLTRFDVSALWVTCVRLGAAGVILAVAAAVRCPARVASVFRSPAALARLTAYGVLGLSLCQYAYMTAISYSNAATTTVLQTLSLVFIMLADCLLERRRPGGREVVSLLLALGGTWLLATGGDLRHMALSPRGLFWGLATAGAVTIYTLLPRRLLPLWGRETITGLGMLFGGIVVNLAARSWTYRVSLSGRGWLALIAIVILGSVLSFSLFMQGIADIGPVKSSMLAATEPVTAAICSAVWLGTRFSPADLAGFACILATIFLLSGKEKDPPDDKLP